MKLNSITFFVYGEEDEDFSEALSKQVYFWWRVVETWNISLTAANLSFTVWWILCTDGPQSHLQPLQFNCSASMSPFQSYKLRTESNLSVCLQGKVQDGVCRALMDKAQGWCINRCRFFLKLTKTSKSDTWAKSVKWARCESCMLEVSNVFYVSAIKIKSQSSDYYPILWCLEVGDHFSGILWFIMHICTFSSNVHKQWNPWEKCVP